MIGKLEGHRRRLHTIRAVETNDRNGKEAPSTVCPSPHLEEHLLLLLLLHLLSRGASDLVQLCLEFVLSDV